MRVLIGAPMAERLPIVRVQANERRGWEMVPGEVHYTYQHPVHVNSLGLRGAEVGAKAEGEKRIFTLGDSLLYGQGVADDQTVPAWMESRLDAEHGADAWTVVNGGHRAYSTNQEIALLEELGPGIEPDVVLVFWFWNDVFERNVRRTFNNLTKSGPIAFDVGSEVEGLTKIKWYAKQFVRRSAAVMFLYDLYRAKKTPPPKQELIEDALARFASYADRLATDAERMGARLVYVIVPEATGLLAPHLSHDIDRSAVEMLAEQNIETVLLDDVLSAYARHLGKLPVLPFDGHYTGDANRVIADTVLDALALP